MFHVVLIHLSLLITRPFHFAHETKACFCSVSLCVALKRSFHYSKSPFLHKDLCCRCLPGSHLLSWLQTSCPSQTWCYISNSAKRGWKTPLIQLAVFLLGAEKPACSLQTDEEMNEWSGCLCLVPASVSPRSCDFCRSVFLPSARRPGRARLVSFYPPLLWAVQARTVTSHIWVSKKKTDYFHPDWSFVQPQSSC